MQHNVACADVTLMAFGPVAAAAVFVQMSRHDPDGLPMF